MPNHCDGRSNAVMICPHCRRELRFLCAWSYRGLWGYNEVRTYECPEHGPVFVGAQAPVVRVSDTQPHSNQDNSDRDSLVSAPRKPAPTPDADAIAIPEPDSD